MNAWIVTINYPNNTSLKLVFPQEIVTDMIFDPIKVFMLYNGFLFDEQLNLWHCPATGAVANIKLVEEWCYKKEKNE